MVERITRDPELASKIVDGHIPAAKSSTRRSDKKSGEKPTKPKTLETPADSVPVPELGRGMEHDLKRPEYYLNRELTWLNYNFRVLAEAELPHTPLLEKIKFISIASSNLDEFFMKRIGGLKQQVGAGVHFPTVDGRTPLQQIDECYELVRELEKRRRRVLKSVLVTLEDRGIKLSTFDNLPEDERERLRHYYFENVFPLVTPQATDPAHPFPFISNLSLNLLVSLRYPQDEDTLLARVKVPIGVGIPRFLAVDGGNTFVTIESVIASNLDLLFPGMEIEDHAMFRVTRNANTTIDEENADDLLAVIESGMRERRFAPIVRLEVAADMRSEYRGMLAAELGLDEHSDVFDVRGLMAVRDLIELAGVEGVLELKDAELFYAPFQPVEHPEMTSERNVFHIIRDQKSILIHHPYQSYATSVERFLREASRDPKVRAMKMTLYRTSADSKAIRYLIEAAQNGKQVAVVVELRARFDEEANIRWANRLEEAGIHVTYGVVGLKTHAKAILVVRQDYDGLRRYAHMGTGNYHAETARLYADFGLITCDDTIGQDLTELFNYLTTGYRPKRKYRKVLPAPKIMKSSILKKIEREISLHSDESPGHIQFKLNALEDPDMTQALYRASKAGIKVDLIVRDTCRLRPGIPGLSDNVRVVSIVGRFLEHTRVYYFSNGGDEEYYIGSADLMKRNLENRVEILAPIEDPSQRSHLRFLLDAQLDDDKNGWEMRLDGSYVHRATYEEESAGSQERVIAWAERRLRAATRLRRRRPEGFRRRNVR
jgi:polyphosphate kinase